MAADLLRRAYASLSALQNNLNKMTEASVEDTYVKEYHSILDRLETIDINVAEFRINASKIKPVSIDIPVISPGRTPYTSGHYSTEKYVKRAFLLMKVEAILGYFTLTTEEPKRTIGFKHE